MQSKNTVRKSIDDTEGDTCKVSQKTDVHIIIIKKGADIFAEFLTIKTSIFPSSL